MKNLNNESVSGKSEDEKAAGIGASFLVGFLIYSFVMTFLSMITTEVASEKGSRVLEVLLASVKPSTHFYGKTDRDIFIGIDSNCTLFNRSRFIIYVHRWRIKMGCCNRHC